MSRESPIPVPMLDQYGIFASHSKQEPDGTIWSQAPPTGVRIELEPAIKSAVFFAKEYAWEQEANININTVLYEAGYYRLWYSISKMRDPSETYVCYAESGDGFAWERPQLNLVEYEGSRANNIICQGRDHYLGAIFCDPNAPADERYKAIAAAGSYYRDGTPDATMDAKQFKELLRAMDLGGVSVAERRRRISIHQSVRASVSPDGIHWRLLEAPILTVGETALDTHNVCTYDPYLGRYVAYLRGHLERRRLIRRAEGEDFRALNSPQPCLMCDPQDSLDDDIYNPCYTPYPGRQLYLMFPSFYHRIDASVDVHLAISRDSYQWHRPARYPIIDRHHAEGAYGMLYAVPNLIDTGKGEWRLPLVGHQRRHHFLERGSIYPEDGEFLWATWQEDRLAGLEASAEGEVVLVQRTCAGQEMRLNYRTAKDGWIKVELVEQPHSPPRPIEAFPGFGLDAAEILQGDELARVVRWNNKSDLAVLRGEEVAVRLHMYKAKVFATAW